VHKRNSVVIELRNLAPERGITNGTRLVVTECRASYIAGRVLEGAAAGSEMLIPRVDLTAAEGDDVPAPFKRRQLPVLPAFAMTVN
jgi:hypothetical protein